MLQDLKKLITHPIRWWYDATHAPCPRCGVMVDVKRWMQHKEIHELQQ